MKRSTTGPFARFSAAFVLLALMPSPSIFAASFDCQKARTKVEKTICDSLALSSLDEEMGTLYSVVVNESDEPGPVKKVQKEWLKKRNTCSNFDCLKHAYTERLAELTKLKEELLATGEDESTDSSVIPPEKAISGEVGRKEDLYTFRLTKGKGTPVCEAYLQRLQQTHFDSMPLCGRPEDDSVPGFTRLNRVYLTAEENYNLYPRVSGFAAYQDQFYRHKDWLPLKWVKFDMELNRLFAWRYDPPVDVDNDGKPDNIIIWSENGYACGSINYKHPHPEGGKFIPNILDQRNEYVDEQRTRELFEHPIGWFGREYKLFRYIGNAIGIFCYQGVCYFDTFYDGWGDFYGKRRDSPKTAHTLAVFLRKDNTTDVICEYYWTNWRNLYYGGK